MASLTENLMNILTRQPKDPNAPKPPAGSRSEREAKLKDKAGLVINIFALFLAVNSWYGGKLSSTVLNNTIQANDTYSFYQAKSIKGTQYEIAAEQATDPKIREKYLATVQRYESDPSTGEGKKELLAKARNLEEERDIAKKRSPWIGYANTAFQLSIVVLSASILAVSVPLFLSSFVVAGLGLVLSSQGLWLWF